MGVASLRFFAFTLKDMEVHLNDPDLQAKIDRWVTETGRGPDELAEDAFAGYFDELAQTRETLWRPEKRQGKRRFMITYDFSP